MQSRSRLLIEHDYRRLQEHKPWGIMAHPLTDENCYQWTAVIQGPQNTDWEGGVFRLYIQFDDGYNDQPPKICFHSIPFHPNIDIITGRPSIDFLVDSNKWNSSMDLIDILVAVQKLLSNPNLNESYVVNSDAANLLSHYPSIYQQTVYQCVAASQTLQDNENQRSSYADSTVTPRLLFHQATAKDAPPVKTVPSAVPRRHHFIPFEDYYSTWNAIATSKTDPRYDCSADLQASLEQSDTPGTLTRITSKYSSSKNNSCHCQQSRPSANKHNKIEHIERMRQLYLQRPKTTPRQLVTQRSLMSGIEPLSGGQRDSTPRNISTERNFELEVDELVSWTDKLDV